MCYAKTSEAGVRVGASGLNCFSLHTELKTAADRYIVTPNNVMLDGCAALDLRQGPVVVHVPALTEAQCTPSRSAVLTGRHAIRKGTQTVDIAGGHVRVPLG